jgi:hypothetical protein
MDLNVWSECGAVDKLVMYSTSIVSNNVIKKCPFAVIVAFCYYRTATRQLFRSAPTIVGVGPDKEHWVI